MESQSRCRATDPALAATEACCAPRALAQPDAWARATAGHREELAAALSGLGLSVVPAVKASFLLVRAPNAEELRPRLGARGIAVRRGDTFPGLVREWFRVAVREPGTQRVAVEALKWLLAG
ncbi:hypothetical protein GCM10027590_36580 [Nocardiopsis nanhaiensis]